MYENRLWNFEMKNSSLIRARMKICSILSLLLLAAIMQSRKLIWMAISML